MRTYTVVIERDADTGLLVGHVPGFPGAHSQAETLDELEANMREVLALLLEGGEPQSWSRP
jgi:predicted RNase H-like HicB family nuclease